MKNVIPVKAEFVTRRWPSLPPSYTLILSVCCTGSRLLYVRDRYLRVHELLSGRDHPLMSLRRPGQTQGASLGQGPRSLQHNAFNPAESNVLVSLSERGIAFFRWDVLYFDDGAAPSWHPVRYVATSSRAAA